MTVFNRDKIIMRSKSLVTHRGVYHTEKLRFATKDSTVIVEAIMFLGSFRRVYKVAKLRSLRGTDER